jgi:Histidine kinase-, DNA gyrase B-, and HSP90-like ATPase
MSESVPAKTIEDTTPIVADTPFSWGPGTPRGAKAVFTRIIKEGANVPLFIGQTLVNALRDLGYNDTTSAICEFVDNSIQWGAKEVRVYFNESGRKGQKRLDVLVADTGGGMAPNVLRAATAFGGSMCFDNRAGIGRYGIGMKGAALSMGSVLQIISWQDRAAFYSMDLDINDVGEDRSNVVNLPSPVFHDQLPGEVVDILTSPMTFPKADAQEPFVNDSSELVERLGGSGTIVYVPDCDRLTYRSARSLVDHATKEMARIYRRQIAAGLKLYVNNRRIEPFDPTYSMPVARHTRVEGLTEKFSRLYRSWEVPIPVEESDPAEVKPVKVRLFVLPFEDWQKLPRKVLKNDLHVFDPYNVSFMRSDREVHAGEMRPISGKHWTGDVWWRVEVDFPAELDEAFGVAVNKQGVRPRGYVLAAIREAIHEDMRKVKHRIEEHYARIATEKAKGPSEAERRANEAEALQGTLLPQHEPMTEEEQRALDEQLRTIATLVKRADETDDQAFERVKTSRYITTFKHDEDMPFYRVDFQVGRVILTINSAHPFFKAIYEPLSRLSKLPAVANGEELEVDSDVAADMLPTLELLLLSLARTQSTMLANDTAGELRPVFDRLRRQWSLDLATQLSMK